MIFMCFNDRSPGLVLVSATHFPSEGVAVSQSAVNFSTFQLFLTAQWTPNLRPKDQIGSDLNFPENHYRITKIGVVFPFPPCIICRIAVSFTRCLEFPTEIPRLAP